MKNCLFGFFTLIDAKAGRCTVVYFLLFKKEPTLGFGGKPSLSVLNCFKIRKMFALPLPMSIFSTPFIALILVCFKEMEIVA